MKHYLLRLGSIAMWVLWGGFFTMLNAQVTVTKTDTVTFSTTTQNMWGPNGSPFTINQDIPIFNQSWNVSGGTGNGGIVNIAGYQFGAAANAGTSGNIGMRFRMQGFTTGDVDVNYPADVTIVYPDSGQYNKGEEVVINSALNARPGAQLITNYPNAGFISLDLNFRLAMYLNATLCAFGCVSFPIIPNFDTGNQTLNIFYADQTQVRFLGPVWPPLSNNLATSRPMFPGQVIMNVQPVTIPDNEFGIDGTISIPKVNTTSSYNPVDKCLYASGDCTYVTLSLEIFKFIAAFLPDAPPPVRAAKLILQNLSGSYTLPAPLGTVYGASVDYTIFSASFAMSNTNKQDFSFCPDFNIRLDFPTPVQYRVTNPAAGNAQVANGTSSSVIFRAGNDLHYYYPCNYDFMNIQESVTLTNTFRNHTFDSLAFDFLMEALKFNLNLPPITVIPRICFPEVCFTIGYPCGWFDWCTRRICTPPFCTPAVTFPGFSVALGPLYTASIPLGNISPINWYNNSWQLGGFGAGRAFPPFRMAPKKYFARMDSLDVACHGGTSGQGRVTVTNGTPPYRFTWMDGIINNNINPPFPYIRAGLPAGPVSTMVTDANGCAVLASSHINEPLYALDILQAQVTDVSCGLAGNGAVDITVTGGTPPYSYLWNNAATTQDITSLAGGLYSVTVTDSKGCTDTISARVNEPAPLAVTQVITPVNCFGGTDGAVDVSVSGGTIPYAYTWSNGGSLQDLVNVGAGTYNLTVSDGNGCTFPLTSVVPGPAAALALARIVTDASCFGFSDGIIDMTTSGGTAPYTYTWQNINNQVLSDTTEDLINRPAGIYFPTVTDANGCTLRVSDTIHEPPVMALSFTYVDVACNGNSTGSIDLSVTGGTPAYNYAWSNGASTQDLVNLAAGTYQVIVSDQHSCTDSVSVNITQPALPLTLSHTFIPVKCNGGSDGSIDLSPNGGTTPYQYLWSSGATTEDLQNLTAGTYSVIVTDANGCLAYDTTLMTQPAAPLNATWVVTDVSCHGGSDGAINVTTTGGTVPYTYLWSNSGFVQLSNPNEDLLNFPTDTYTLLITDSNACTFSSPITVNEPTQVLHSVTSTAVSCYNGNDGSIDLSVSGGTVPYAYSWSNGASTQDQSAIQSGMYLVTITDGNACVSTDSVFVSQPANPLMASVTGTNVGCFGGSSAALDLSVSGGTPPYTYLWSNGATTEDNDSLPSGTYTVTVTDANGCQAFSGKVVNQPAAPLSVTFTTDSASCQGSNDGSITIYPVGGTTPYAYQWADTFYLLNQNAETLPGVAAGTYSVRVKDENNCEVLLVITVAEPTGMNPQYTVTPVNCNGGSDGAIDLIPAGGSPPYGFVWSNGATTEDLNGIPAGNYSVKISDANNCRKDVNASVPEPPPISVSEVIKYISCRDQHDGEIHVTASGGTPGFLYSWSNGVNFADIVGLEPGFYVLTVTDMNGCLFQTSYTLASPENECINIPTSFSPNGDGVNDSWILRNLDLYPNASLLIYNQWGTEVYRSGKPVEPWKGTYRGSLLPAATYYYILDLGNGEPPYTGPVTILE